MERAIAKRPNVARHIGQACHNNDKGAGGSGQACHNNDKGAGGSGQAYHNNDKGAGGLAGKNRCGNTNLFSSGVWI